MIQIKRAYEEATPDDGFRILVDRLWPRTGQGKIKNRPMAQGDSTLP